MKIVKVISVKDTREYELEATAKGDRWVPIPGSGHEHECFRCGRIHEIHATVLLDNGDEQIVGTGCMKADEAEMATQIRSLTSAAKTLKRLIAEHERMAAKLEKWNSLIEYHKASRPSVTLEQNDRKDMYYYHCGSATVWGDGPGSYDHSERIECVIELYCRIEAAKELGDDKLRWQYPTQSKLNDIMKRIQKIEKKIAA